MNEKNYGFLSGNVLKIIALVCMTIDHIGSIIFPDILVLRAIGRIAFPIFAYFIAEGCKYTRNKTRYLFQILLLAILCQITSTIANGFGTLNILWTFSFSIVIIYCYMWLKQSCLNKNKRNIWLSVSCLIICIAITYLIAEQAYRIIPWLSIDYGFWGAMVAVSVSIFNKFYIKVLMLAVSLLLLCLHMPVIQIFCFLSVLLILFYNGKKGKYSIKYLFYIYYPLHLSLIHLISLLL